MKKKKQKKKPSGRSFGKRLLRGIVKLVLVAFLGSILAVVVFRFVPVLFTPLMVIRCVEQWQADEDIKLKKKWKPMAEISESLQLAVVCAEDQKFPEHNGFDFEAIEKAWEHNRDGKRKRGASTISQQCAKNLFLWPGRTWVRKGLETYFTVLIELLWSKERILEVYLNIIELGNGVYGAEAAAQEFFNTSAQKLSRPQAALLAAVLPNPRQYSAAKPSAYVRGRQGWVLVQMKMWDYQLILEKGKKE